MMTAESIQPIRDDEHLDEVLAEIRSLWGAKRGTPEGNRFEVLSILANSYEREHHAIPAPSKDEALRYRLEQAGVPDDLVEMVVTRQAAQLPADAATLRVLIVTAIAPVMAELVKSVLTSVRTMIAEAVQPPATRNRLAVKIPKHPAKPKGRAKTRRATGAVARSADR